MGSIASQITSLNIVYSAVYSGADQRKHQSSVSLAFVRGIHRGPVNSPHKWPVTRKMFPFDEVIMFHNIFFPRRGTTNLATVYFLLVNSAAHNTLISSCDCFMWLVSSGEEEQNVCIGVLKQSMFLLQQNCTTFLSSNTRAGFHLLQPNSRCDTGKWRRLIKYLHSFEPFCGWHLPFASHAFAIFFFPPSVRWPPSWKICLRTQLSFGFWGRAVKAFDNFSWKLAWLLILYFRSFGRQICLPNSPK